jgi:hypothetical protein
VSASSRCAGGVALEAQPLRWALRERPAGGSRCGVRSERGSSSNRARLLLEPPAAASASCRAHRTCRLRHLLRRGTSMLPWALRPGLRNSPPMCMSSSRARSARRCTSTTPTRSYCSFSPERFLCAVRTERSFCRRARWYRPGATHHRLKAGQRGLVNRAITQREGAMRKALAAHEATGRFSWEPRRAHGRPGGSSDHPTLRLGAVDLAARSWSQCILAIAPSAASASRHLRQAAPFAARTSTRSVGNDPHPSAFGSPAAFPPGGAVPCSLARAGLQRGPSGERHPSRASQHRRSRRTTRPETRL